MKTSNVCKIKPNKTKAWLECHLCHLARKWIRPILQHEWSASNLYSTKKKLQEKYNTENIYQLYKCTDP